jgi:hypothetical protein
MRKIHTWIKTGNDPVKFVIEKEHEKRTGERNNLLDKHNEPPEGE